MANAAKSKYKASPEMKVKIPEKPLTRRKAANIKS
jgi:hypothetical protein